MKKTGIDGGEVRLGKRFRKPAVTGSQAIACTQEMTANICTPMLLEAPMSLS
jgi:hypothetical protein